MYKRRPNKPTKRVKRRHNKRTKRVKRRLNKRTKRVKRRLNKRTKRVKRRLNKRTKRGNNYIKVITTDTHNQTLVPLKLESSVTLKNLLKRQEIDIIRIDDNTANTSRTVILSRKDPIDFKRRYIDVYPESTKQHIPDDEYIVYVQFPHVNRYYFINATNIYQIDSETRINYFDTENNDIILTNFNMINGFRITEKETIKLVRNPSVYEFYNKLKKENP